MEKVLEHMDTCYGCGACCNACSMEAITMQPDSEGFLYPVIQTDRCVDCDLCRQVCPVLHTEFTNEEQAECYAVIGPDELRLKSSSGGAFTALAEYALRKGGLVCGAAMTDDFTAVEHIIVDGEDGLDKLRKSKYVQSDTKNVYQETEKALQGGRFVLFSGTPCQVAGLKSYLGREYEQLITVDLVCHGVPSPGAWRKFLKETAENRKIKNVSFRDNRIAWATTTTICFEDGTSVSKRDDESLWLKGLRHDLINRNCCGSCPFPFYDRVGDITIADFWNMDHYLPTYNDGKGISLVLVNNKKGAALFSEIRKNPMWKTKEVPSARYSQPTLYKSYMPHPGRKLFFQDLQSGVPFERALEDGLAQKYDFGILGYWFTNNYGALITSFALYFILKDMGYSSFLVDVPDMVWRYEDAIRDDQSSSRRFISRYCPLSPRYSSKADLKKLNAMSDGFLVGSDQLWGWYENKYAAEGGFYFLEFAEEGKKKIAYGTSFGFDDFIGGELDVNTCGYLLNRFGAVSVREKQGVEICRKRFGIEATHVLDPVFLCNKAYYLDAASTSALSRTVQNKYIAAYILQPTEEKMGILKYLSEKLGFRLVIIPNLHDSGETDSSWGDLLQFVRKQTAIEDWLYYISNAEFVVTDSYHGFCFSVIFERNFICLQPRDTFSRFVSLAELIGFMDRIGIDGERVQSDDTLFSKIDFTNAKTVLEKEKNRCLTWLKEALRKPVENRADFSTYDMLGTQMDLAVGSLREEFKEYRKEDNQMANGNVYFDGGDGFSEENKEAFSYDAEKNRIELSVRVPVGTKKLRFDPVEGAYCMVSDVTVSSDGRELPVTEHNGLEIENQILFLTEDPQLLIKIPESGIGTVCISAVVSSFTGGGALKILQTAALLQQKNSELQQQADGQKTNSTQWQCRAEEDERSIQELRKLSEAAEKRADEAEKRASEAERHANEAEERVNDRNTCLKNQTMRAEQAERELESLYASTAYKVGRVLTFTPKRPQK